MPPAAHFHCPVAPKGMCRLHRHRKMINTSHNTRRLHRANAPWPGVEPPLLSHAPCRPLSLSSPHSAHRGGPPAMTQTTAAGLQRHGARSGRSVLSLSLAVPAARGECLPPFCPHPVTHQGLCQDRATITESLSCGAPDSALTFWYFSGSGKLFSRDPFLCLSKSCSLPKSAAMSPATQ